MAARPAQRPPLWIVIAGSGVLCAILVLLVWARERSATKAEAEAVETLVLVAPGSPEAIEACLSRTMRLTSGDVPHGNWEGSNPRFAWHMIRKTRFELRPVARGTQISVFTPKGRALRADERIGIARCSDPHLP